MDVAYDHIQEETLPQDPPKPSPSQSNTNETNTPASPSLNAEFQEAYKSITTTPWGAKLGGFFTTVSKQSSTFYDGARQEASAASGEALKGFQDLKASLASRARSLSNAEEGAQKDGEEGERSEKAGKSEGSDEKEKEGDGEGMVARFRAEASKRLRELEKAEEAADAAILRFGTNLGSFLKEAVTIAPPSTSTSSDGKSKVLFESKGEDGKRVIHSTRLEAQLHAIHTSADKFTKDPQVEGKEGVGGWEEWKKGFDVEKSTGEIEGDLGRFEELRRMMERLVPEKVEYKDFWCRYYFLRDLVEKEEQRRREVLKGMLPNRSVYTDTSRPYHGHDVSASEADMYNRCNAIPSRRPHILGRRL